MLGAVGDAVLAGCARNGANGGHLVRHMLEDGQLMLGERFVLLEQGDLVLHLLHLGHAGEHGDDLGDGLQEPEAPSDGDLPGLGGLELLHVFVIELRQGASAQRLHDPYGKIVLGGVVDLLLAILEHPVEVVDLQLDELHVLAVGLHEPLQVVEIGVAGEPEMPDLPLFPHLDQERDVPVLGVEVLLDVGLADVVDEVVVEVPRAGLLELLLEDLLGVPHVGHVVSGELVGEEVAVPRVFGERLAHDGLGVAAVVAPCGIVVVYPLFHRLVDERVDLLLNGFRIVAVRDRKAHRAECELGDPVPFEIGIYHPLSSVRGPSLPLGRFK